MNRILLVAGMVLATASAAAADSIKATVGHMCCGGCVADLKTNMAAIRSQVLDKDNIKVDQATKTVIVQPVAGKELNLVALLRQLQSTGFAASSCTVATVVASAK